MEITRFGCITLTHNRWGKLHRLQRGLTFSRPSDSGAGVARTGRGRAAGYRQFLAWGGAGVARAWRGRGAG
eukprot:gene17293-biopygen14393